MRKASHIDVWASFPCPLAANRGVDIDLSKAHLVLSQFSLRGAGGFGWVLVEPCCWEKDLVHGWSVPSEVPRKAVGSCCRSLAAFAPKGAVAGRDGAGMPWLISAGRQRSRVGLVVDNGEGASCAVGMSNSCRVKALPETLSSQKRVSLWFPASMTPFVAWVVLPDHEAYGIGNN